MIGPIRLLLVVVAIGLVVSGCINFFDTVKGNWNSGQCGPLGTIAGSRVLALALMEPLMSADANAPKARSHGLESAVTTSCSGLYPRQNCNLPISRASLRAGFSRGRSPLCLARMPANSSSTIGRLKDAWSDEHVRWSRRDLWAKRFVYLLVDGIHVQARLEDDAQCLLVIIGATPEGEKELVGLIDGVRESTQSWRELLLDLKRRGLVIGPELAVADGALGYWQAVEDVWPKMRGQRCWVHKTANVLNKLPKSQQSKAKRALQEIWMAETKKDALVAFAASSKPGASNTTRRRNAWSRTVTRCSLSMTSRPSLEASVQPTPSKARSRRCATERCAPKDVSQTRPRSP